MSYLIGAAALGIVIIFCVLRWLRQFRLAREGVVTQGRVIRKSRPFGNKVTGPLTYLIRYDFITPRGEFIKNSVLVGEVVSHLHEEGSEIDVVYLRNHPAISNIKEAVNSSRKAMNLPPL
jgi:hypothetical protein